MRLAGRWVPGADKKADPAAAGKGGAAEGEGVDISDIIGSAGAAADEGAREGFERSLSIICLLIRKKTSCRCSSAEGLHEGRPRQFETIAKKAAKRRFPPWQANVFLLLLEHCADWAEARSNSSQLE